jgi:hypothetical protein
MCRNTDTQFFFRVTTQKHAAVRRDWFPAFFWLPPILAQNLASFSPAQSDYLPLGAAPCRSKKGVGRAELKLFLEFFLM